jgi:hypothetical protein
MANLFGIAEVPKFSNTWMRRIVSGWRLGAASTLQSGAFYTVTTGEDNAYSGVGGQRPHQVLLNVYGNGTAPDWINPNAFSFPAGFTYGNVGPGTILGPAMLLVNAGLSRIFPVREKQTLEVRIEAENALNHVNLGPPILTMNSPLFGQITSAGPARIMQLAMKYVF